MRNNRYSSSCEVANWKSSYAERSCVVSECIGDVSRWTGRFILLFVVAASMTLHAQSGPAIARADAQSVTKVGRYGLQSSTSVSRTSPSRPTPRLPAESVFTTPGERRTFLTTPIFVFHSDEFWLNLHHFLYVLGRAANKERDASRVAVAGAPTDQERGLAKLTPQEQAIWREAVSSYAKELSKKDLVFDDPLPSVTNALAQAGAAPSLTRIAVDFSTAAILQRAAPVYRKAWWPQHHGANEAWRLAIQRLVDQRGDSVLAFITRAYQLKWPGTGFGVHISSYTNWAGAYSTTGNLLVISSLSEENRGTYGLETVFHEGMHQWDGPVLDALQKEAQKLNRVVPNNLSHALIFFTAGEAIRKVAPEHIPVAEKFGVWQRGWGSLKSLLDEVWKPYLDGRGTRDEAFAELIKCADAETRPRSQPATKVGRYLLQSNPWVNLHQRLLYEARFKEPPPAALSGEDLANWKKAVEIYRVFLGNRNPIVDDELKNLNATLSKTNTPELPDSIPDAASQGLKIAMPLYRSSQWDEDDRVNRFWIAVAEPMLAAAAEELIEAHAKAYAMPFPKHILVDVSRFAWEFGAYTVPEPESAHVVISSTDRGSQGFWALEALMHEPSHAIAGPTSGAIGSDLTRIASELGVKPRPFLWHAILFYTYGELTRRALTKRGVINYQPVILEMYKIGFREFQQPLETHWQAYLDGNISREEAIRQILIETASAKK